MPNRLPLYERILALYPKLYREEYAEQIMQTLADILDDQPPGISKRVMQLRIIIDLLSAIFYQNIISLGNTYMNISKKIMASIVWIIVSIIAIQLVKELRLIGMDWINTAGFLRVMALLLFSLIFVVGPLLLAVLTWFERPKWIYKYPVFR